MIWRPDTCGCTLHVYMDETLPIDQREWIVDSVPIKCAVHAGLPDEDAYKAVRKENGGVQQARAAAIDSDPSMKYTLSPQEISLLKILHRINNPGDTNVIDVPTEVFHPDKSLSHSFDKNRNVVISFSGLSPQEESVAQAAVAQKIADWHAVIDNEVATMSSRRQAEVINKSNVLIK